MKEQKHLSLLFVKKLDTDKYLIYNSAQHIPAVFNKRGKLFVETIFKSNRDFSKSVKHIKKEHQEEFTDFYQELKKNDFLNIEDTHIKHEYNDNEILKTKKTFYFFVTDKCNLNCAYCFNKNIRTNFNDLSLSKWKKIIDEIKEHIGTITITGGEPSLFKPLFELIKYIKKVTSDDVYIDMFTNGSMPFYKDDNNKYFQILTEINKLTISCDNITDDNHRRKGFSRDIFFKNIEWLKQNGFTNKVTLNSVYSRNNIEEIKGIKAYATSNNMKFTYALSLPQKKSDKKYMPYLKEYKNCLYNDDILGTNSEKSNSEIPINLKCSAAATVFSIDSQGNCFPCQNFHFPKFYLGNLLQNSFKEIYFSKPAILLRNHTVYDSKTCKDCNLKYICAGGCIADTYKLHKSINEYPSIMCPYYKAGAINRLIKNNYE